MHFKVTKAIIVGQRYQTYRVFAIDESRDAALKFELYTTSSLNDLTISKASLIKLGNLSQDVSVNAAITALEEIKVDQQRPPKQPNFSALIEFLKMNVN